MAVALVGYAVKAGDADLGVDATAFLRAVARWESSAIAEGTLGYADGEIIFVNTKCQSRLRMAANSNEKCR